MHRLRMLRPRLSLPAQCCHDGVANLLGMSCSLGSYGATQLRLMAQNAMTTMETIDIAGPGVRTRGRTTFRRCGAAAREIAGSTASSGEMGMFSAYRGTS